MKISIRSIAGVKFAGTIDQALSLEKIASELRTAFDSVGFRTDVRVSIDGKKAAIFFGYKCAQEKKPLISRMAMLDTAKHGKSFIWTKDGVESNRGQLDWIQKIYMNNLTNDILDANNVVAEIQVQFKDAIRTGVIGKDGKEIIKHKLREIMFVRSVETGGVRQFGKEPNDTSFCTNALFEKGLAPTRLPLRRFKNELCDAIAIAVVNGKFDAERDFSENRLVQILQDDPSLIKFIIHNAGEEFLRVYGLALEKHDVRLAKYACSVDPRNANYFNTLDVQVEALNTHGLAAIKFIDNPSSFLKGHVIVNWPNAYKVLADLDAIRLENQDAPPCPCFKPVKKIRKAKEVKEVVKAVKEAKEIKKAVKQPKAKVVPKAKNIKQVVKTVKKLTEGKVKAKPVVKDKAKKELAALAAVEVAVQAVVKTMVEPKTEPIVETTPMAEAMVKAVAKRARKAKEVKTETLIEAAKEIGKLEIVTVTEPTIEPVQEVVTEAPVKQPKEFTKPYCKLVGMDGNTYAVLGAVARALKKAGRADLAEEFRAKATTSNYDQLLVTAMEYVEIN
jgi:hypothetical protein